MRVWFTIPLHWLQSVDQLLSLHSVLTMPTPLTLPLCKSHVIKMGAGLVRFLFVSVMRVIKRLKAEKYYIKV